MRKKTRSRKSRWTVPLKVASKVDFNIVILAHLMQCKKCLVFFQIPVHCTVYILYVHFTNATYSRVPNGYLRQTYWLGGAKPIMNVNPHIKTPPMQRKSSVPPAVCLGGFIALTEGGFFRQHVSPCEKLRNRYIETKTAEFFLFIQVFYFIYLLNWHAVVERPPTVPSYNQDIFINRIH